MPKKTNQRIIATLRGTREEHDEILRRAAAAGLSLSKYLRRCVGLEKESDEDQRRSRANGAAE